MPQPHIYVNISHKCCMQPMQPPTNLCVGVVLGHQHVEHQAGVADLVVLGKCACVCESGGGAEPGGMCEEE